MNKIKIFTTSDPPDRAGNDLTNKCTNWQNNFENGIEIIQFHTNSNKFGWSLTILYKIL